MTRVRTRFAKLGKIRWTSHRDTARMWERAFRRVELRLAYTAGFSPRPKVSFGLALPTGYESVAEYLDVELAAESSAADGLEALAPRLSAALPAGVDVVAIDVVDSPATGERPPSLQEDVTCCTWRLAVVPAGEATGGIDVGARISRLLEAGSLVVTRQRKGKDVTEDIRPAIRTLHLLEGAGLLGGAASLLDDRNTCAWLQCDLATQPRSLRPSELVAALGGDLEVRDVRRLHQWIERDGARWEPLVAPPAATEAPHALGRAS